MALGTTQLADIIVPAIFHPYTQNLTTEKTAIIQSGAVVEDALLADQLAGAGLTFNTPSFKDLDNEAEDIMTDDVDDVYSSPPYNAPLHNSVPRKIQTLQEISVRLSRHMSWSSVQLAADLAGANPLNAIQNRVAYFWARRRQAAFIALMTGVYADNDAAPTGTEHVQFDLTYDASGANFQQGVTEFNTVNFLRAALTMGDNQEALGLILVHSVVYHKMQINNLLDFVADATNPNAEAVPTFLGRRVIVDDGMPFNAGTNVYQSWLFGPGAVRFGAGAPRLPVELERAPRAGQGAGQDILHNRVHWCFHPVGYRYDATAPSGGPSNASTTNNLANVATWKRVYPERKQIRMARLLTREF